MKTCKVPLLQILVLTICTTAFARIGETIDQCKARYADNPLSGLVFPIDEILPGYSSGVFIKSAYRITITFRPDGRAVCLVYEKTPEEGMTYADLNLNDTDVQTFLDANSASWVKQSEGSWESGDGRYIASFDGSRELTICTKVYADALANAGNEAAKSLRQGF
jgi:hypothetical protein